MSSQLTSLVPILDGTNYQQWSSAMSSYLMAQGQWKCVKSGASDPSPPTKVVETEIETEKGKKKKTETVWDWQDETYLKAKAEWDEDAEKALGNICLRIHFSISAQFAAMDVPNKLWAKLKENYGSPGLHHAFIEFKQMIDTPIPNGQNPNPACDKIMAHFANLEVMKWEIPPNICTMILLSKIPKSLESVVQMFLQVITQKLEKGEETSPTKVVQAIRQGWETATRSGSSGKNQQQANKLSTVKLVGNQPPSFQQQQQQPNQQQQRGQGGGRGKGARRGKRGQGKNPQQQLQQTMVQDTMPGQ